MKAEKLIPDKPDKPKTPKCDGKRSSTYCSDETEEPYRCKKNSTIKIDNYHFCRVHAGQFALSLLLGEDYLEHIFKGE